MAVSYIPQRDADVLVWLKNFSDHLTLDPGRYGVTAGDAANVKAAVDAYEAAFGVVGNPLTRNSSTIIEKDEARNAAVQLCRQYAILIKHNAGITNADKNTIGVPPVNPTRNPVAAPTTSPLLNVIGATPGAHTVRYADSMTPDTGRKPVGVKQLQLFVAVAEAPVDDAGLGEFYGAFTRNPIGVGFAEADDGKVATYFARWATARGEVGPWSLPVSMRVVA